MQDARGHEMSNAKVIEDLMLLYQIHGLPYEESRGR